jgi:DNA ligase (NAD+)
MIREKGIMLGDTLIVERAGEVIPYIVGVVPDLRNGSEQPLVFPSNCPSCASPLIRPNEEVVWRCENADCPAQLEERIIHFVSKEAMDIDGLGRQIVIDFIANGLLKNIEGIYALDFETIRTLEGWGEKSIENLKNGIEQSKKRPLWRLLVALGIRHVGTGTAKDIAGHILSIHELSTKTVEDLVAIEGIGPKVANSIHDFFTNEANIHLIHDLEKLGLNTVNNPAENALASNKLNGQTFLFTGTLTQFGRDRAKQLVEENGGKLLSAVSVNLNYLVAGESAGSKLTKAKAIPSIKIITEEDFLTLIA